MTHPIHGVTTRVYAPKKNTDRTTTLKKNPDTHSVPPSLMTILVNPCFTARVFARVLTNAGQSLSAAEITRPK